MYFSKIISFNSKHWIRCGGLIWIQTFKTTYCLNHLGISFWRFINARRRIVQPMIEKSTRLGKTAMVGTYKSRKRKADEMAQHYPPVNHYSLFYQQEQHLPAPPHTGYYQDDAISQNFYNPRPFYPYVDPAAGSSSQPSSIPRCPVLPYTHRTHSVSPSFHASSYHGTMPPSVHHGYHIGHQPVLPHTAQTGLTSYPSMSEPLFDPHY